MKVVLKEDSAIKRTLAVTVPAAVLGQHLEAAYQEIGKKAKLKGFRPGKVPRPILEKYYRQDAEEGALQAVLQNTYPEALIREGLQPVSAPEIKIVSYQPSQELTYEATFEVRPELAEVKGYQGMKLTQPVTEVTDQEVVDRIKALQESHAKLVPIDPPRRLTKGDVVTLDYEALREGQPFEGNKVAGYMAELGTGSLLPEFETELQKLKPGEKNVIHVTFPVDFADKNFAGKKMSYNVEIKDAKLKVVPEANDDFAKDLGLTTLKELNERVRADLTQTKEQSARNQLHRQIIQKLAEQNSLEIPGTMTQRELEAMYNQLIANLQRQKLSPEKVGLTKEGFWERNREEAILRIRGILFFEAIWKEENLSVSPEEREQKMELLATSIGQHKEMIAQYYRQDPARLGQLDAMILEDKTLDLILGKATMKAEETKKTK